MSTAARLILMSSFAMMLAGCATEGIRVKIMRPAPVSMAEYDLIAVDLFGGEAGPEFVDDLMSGLGNAKNPLTGQADFEIMDRREVDRMIDDLRGRPGKEWDDKAMRVLERWRKAEVVLRGDVQTYEVQEQIVEQPWMSVDGVTHVRYTRSCNAVVEVLIEASDSSGDNVFDSVTYKEVVPATRTSVDTYPDEVDQNALLANARRKVIARYLRRIMPHEDYVTVNLFTDGSLPELQIGNGFAATGDWEAAGDSYGDAVQRARGELAAVRYKALFNLGVAFEYTNRFDEARKALKDSYALGQDGMALQELQNIRARENEYELLLQQGKAGAKPAK